MYWGLRDCPECGHRSLDRLPKWEGCERRKCGYQRSFPEGRNAVGSGHNEIGAATRQRPAPRQQEGWS